MTVTEIENSNNCRVKVCTSLTVVKTRPLFTQDSKFVILAHECDAKVYSIQSGECVQTLRHHKSCLISLQENKKNQLQIFTCSEDGNVARWDYIEGTLLETVELGIPVFCFFAPFSDKDTFFYVAEERGQHGLFSFTESTHKSIVSKVKPSETLIAFGFEGEFVAVLNENSLTVRKSDDGLVKKHLVKENYELTCIACHPTDFVVATGDNSGRIIVWSSIFENRPVKTIYHWHHLPVADLVFSTEGYYLYSAGGEAVLVKWFLSNSERNFLPRLGAPILRLSASRDNHYVLTAHNDNSLAIINTQFVVVQVIQGLTQGHFLGSKDQCILPTGLLYDPCRRGIALNGRPGHLQFYNVQEDKQVFNLDICRNNFIPSDKDKNVLNTDIQKAAIDSSGNWLASVEYWGDGENSPQIWLKFWKFHDTQQTYVLNTNVILPHNKEVNCILFQPALNETTLAVTTSKDCRFKIWNLGDDPAYEDKQTWTCTSVCCYRDLPAGDACFSEEGSLLAVAFKNAATLWTVEGKAKLRAVLCRQNDCDPLKQVVFGRKSCAQYLLCHDGASITAWDVLSYSTTWIVHSTVQVMVADIASDFVAAFYNKQDLILFKPDDPKPRFTLLKASESPIIAAVFVPLKKDSLNSLGCSQLFFYNSAQILLTLTDEPEEENNENNAQNAPERNVPLTPYGMLQAKTIVSNVVKAQSERLFGLSSIKNPDLVVSCPTLTDPVVLCTKLLESLLIPSQKSRI